MTTNNYISENKTEIFSKGDKVVMHSCHEATFPEYNGKIWKCQTDSFQSKSSTDFVFLEGFSGCFLCRYLQIVKP